MTNNWQRIKRIVGLLFALLLLITLGLYLYYAITSPNSFPNWTGYGEYAPLSSDVTRAKTLWDWMDLLFVPIILALGLYLLNQSARRNEQEIAINDRNEDRKIAEIQREIALDNQHQNTLEMYFDRMTGLLLNQGLRDSQEGDEVRTIARTQTLATLRSLDPKRKGFAVQFLFESGLIHKNNAIVKLEGADLEGIYLNGAKLGGSLLNKVNLKNADLHDTDLSNADLSYSNLNNANLRGSELHRTNLSNTDLRGAELGETMLEEANMYHANMRGANLYSANLREADLEKAILNEANLNEAFLVNAHIHLTDMMSVSLGGANLTGTDLENIFLTWSKYDDTTIWPDGFDPAKAVEAH